MSAALEDFRAWLLARDGERMLAVRLFPDAGVYTGVHRLIYHYTLIIGIIGDRDGYEDRWCYGTLPLALVALASWDADKGGEPTGWRKHPASGRRVAEATE